MGEWPFKLAPESFAAGRNAGGGGRYLIRRWRGCPLLLTDRLRRAIAFVRAWDVQRPALRCVEQPADIIRRMGDRRTCINLRQLDRHCVRLRDCDRHWRPHGQRIAGLAGVTAGKCRRLAPAAWPAIENVLPDLDHLRQQRRPPRRDIVGMVMGRLANRFLDVARESGTSDLLGLVPDRCGRPPVERAVADERELAYAGPRALVDDATD